jgi:hypothetical protein
VDNQCLFRTKLPSGLRVTVNHMSPATRDEFNIKEPCDLSFDGLRSLTDELVIAHLRAGHGDALGVLFDRYHRLVLHVALKIIHDVGEAEDVKFKTLRGIARTCDPWPERTSSMGERYEPKGGWILPKMVVANTSTTDPIYWCNSNQFQPETGARR